MSNSSLLRTVALLAVGAAIGFVVRGSLNENPQPILSDSGKAHFNFIVGGPDRFWDQVIAGAEAAAKEFDVNLEVHIPSGKPEDQTRVLAQVASQGTSGVAISPLDPTEQTLLLSRLAASTHLITFDNDAPHSLRHCYVGTNNYIAGKMCGKTVQEARAEGAKVVVFIGDVERQNAADRLRGFYDAIVQGSSMLGTGDYPLEKPYSGGNITVIKTYLDDQDPKQAVKNVKNALEEHPDINCMVGLYGYNGPACLQVLEEQDKLEDITLIAFDEHEATLEGIANGKIHASIVQGSYEYGFETVRLMSTLHERNEHSIPLGGTGFVFLPCKVVNQENVEEHRASLASRLADRKTSATPKEL